HGFLLGWVHGAGSHERLNFRGGSVTARSADQPRPILSAMVFLGMPLRFAHIAMGSVSPLTVSASLFRSCTGSVSARSTDQPLPSRLCMALRLIPVCSAQADMGIVLPLNVSRRLLRLFRACSIAVAHRQLPGS